MDRDLQVELLALARKSIESYFDGTELLLPDTDLWRGAFVTLRKNGDLRGCIGYLEPVAPLYRQIFMLARDAAFNDIRFNPLTKDELTSCKIEISILTPPVFILSLEDFILSKHGIVMEKGGRRAIFLPQVAEETGWSKSELLSALSRKAGLFSDAWKAPDASFKVFEVESFEE